MEERFCEVCGELTDPSNIDLFATKGRYVCPACLAKEQAASMPAQELQKNPETAPFFEEPQPMPAEPERMRFPCPMCSAVLSIKPVASKSKLSCPSCKGALYVYPDGRVEIKGAKQTGIVPVPPIQAVPESAPVPPPVREPAPPPPAPAPPPSFGQTEEMPAPEFPPPDKSAYEYGQTLDMAALPPKEEPAPFEMGQTIDMSAPPMQEESEGAKDFGQTLDIGVNPLDELDEEDEEDEFNSRDFEQTLDIVSVPREAEPPPKPAPPVHRASPPPRPAMPEPIPDNVEFKLDEEEIPALPPRPAPPKPAPKPAPPKPEPIKPAIVSVSPQRTTTPAKPQPPAKPKTVLRSQTRRRTAATQQPVRQATPILPIAAAPAEQLRHAGTWMQVEETLESVEFKKADEQRQYAFIARAVCVVLLFVPAIVFIVAANMASAPAGGEQSFIDKLGETGKRGMRVLNERSVRVPMKEAAPKQDPEPKAEDSSRESSQE